MKKPVIILLHVGYWLVFLLLLFVLYGLSSAAALNNEQDPGVGAGEWFKLMFSTTILPGVICFYTFYFIIFSRFLQKRRIPAFFISVFIASYVAAIIGGGVGSLNYFLGHFFLLDKNLPTVLSMLTFLAFIALLNGVIGLVMRGFITWYSEIKMKEDLNKKNFEMELALVKSQINPHFLFNTINNIDVLITKEPELASKYLNTLSDIMRFMLYETKAESILLTKELAYIEKFIGLHKIRSNNPDYVHYTVTGSAPNMMIAPMLFIPFIENAFKHVADKKANPAISISLNIDKEKITFICQNNFKEETREENEHSGLGDGLIRKRLQLLYPDKHELTVTTDNNIYAVYLTISC
jgi:two-component system LytT family sensor kinase